MTLIIIALAYVIGYYLSYSMLRIEHASENRPYTYGDRLAGLAISLGSFLTIIIVLVITWIKYIERSGYWRKPIKPVPPAAQQSKKEDAK